MTAASSSSLPLRPFRVFLDAINPDEPVNAYTRGDRWNGWECPFFTRDQAATFARIWRASIHCSAGYDAATDDWLFYDPENPEQPMRVTGQAEVDAEGRALHVYCIGGWEWCWVEAS
jgi:hypothetical protein